MKELYRRGMGPGNGDPCLGKVKAGGWPAETEPEYACPRYPLQLLSNRFSVRFSDATFPAEISHVTSSSSRRLLKIATRSSRLALWQAEHVASLLRAAAPECDVELLHVSTIGDRDLAGSLRSFGGMGVFTREVQNVVLAGLADIAVHSLKDLPTDPHPDLVLASVPERAETADALILPSSASADMTWEQLPQGARIGTGSLRRRAQLLHARPDFIFSEARGNVETRLRKLDEGEFDGLILAVAGLQRLELADRIRQQITPPQMYHAVGQGALGIECRAGDQQLREILDRIGHIPTWQRVLAERALLRELRAGCHAPVGVATTWTEAELTLEAVVLSPDGSQRILDRKSTPPASAEQLGLGVASALLSQGADKLIHQSG